MPMIPCSLSLAMETAARFVKQRHQPHSVTALTLMMTQSTLRKDDFDKVIKSTEDISVAMSKPNNQARVSELRAEVMEILKPFPELAQDYDRFAASARSTAAAVGARR